MTALEIAREVLAELDAGRPDAERILALARAVVDLTEDVEAADQRMAGVLDGTFAIGDGTAQTEIERLLAEIDLLRPVVDLAEQWTDSSSVHDDVLMDAVRAMRRARET